MLCSLSAANGGGGGSGVGGDISQYSCYAQTPTAQFPGALCHSGTRGKRAASALFLFWAPREREHY